jgi:hypothetical protein
LSAQITDSELLPWDGTDPRSRRGEVVGGLPGHNDRGEHVRLLENLLGMSEIDDRLDPGILGKKTPEWLAVGGFQPLVRYNERKPAARLEYLHPQFVKVNVKVSRPVEGFESLLKVGLVGGDPFLSDIRRVSDDDVETALLEYLRKCRVPVQCLRMHHRIGDHAVSHADVVIKTRERFATLGGLDPQAEPTDLHRFLVQV